MPTLNLEQKEFRFPITRKIIYAILDGTINDTDFETDPYFGVEIPTSLDDLGPETLLSQELGQVKKNTKQSPKG